MAGIDPQEQHIAEATLRRYIEPTGFAWFLDSPLFAKAVEAMLTEVENYRVGVEPVIAATKSKSSKKTDEKDDD